ncbi:hypothetical protein [Methylorubrum thiocyanatum]|uniref:hypothetical protein n=1 Tax=Methylorubrum thiocyanatum TaxID=47958 RepID=UPI00364B9934
MTEQEHDGIYIEYDEEGDASDVEVWRSYDEYLDSKLEAILGRLERIHWLDGVAYFQTMRGFPLLALRAYLEGVEYRVSLTCILVDEHLTEDGLRISGQEALFIPMVTEEHLYEFAERCIGFEMLS